MPRTQTSFRPPPAPRPGNLNDAIVYAKRTALHYWSLAPIDVDLDDLLGLAAGILRESLAGERPPCRDTVGKLADRLHDELSRACEMIDARRARPRVSRKPRRAAS